jgi:hypothetical protein
MDLNQLFHFHQLSIMQAASTHSCEERSAYRQSAAHYAGCIAALQADLGAISPFRGDVH